MIMNRHMEHILSNSLTMCLEMILVLSLIVGINFFNVLYAGEGQADLWGPF